MKQKDLKTFMRMHELAARFEYHSGTNINAAQLCHLDNSVLKQLLGEGYKPIEILEAFTESVFKGNKKRYETLKKFIEDFDKKQKNGSKKC